MPKPRNINADPSARKLSSTLAVTASPVREVAWIVEERVVWRGADLFRTLLEAIKWPFEQVAWHAERRIVWPVQERTAGWSTAARAGITVGVALILAGLIAALALSPSSSNEGAKGVLARSDIALPAAPPEVPAAAPARTLHGAPPVFAAGAGTGGVKASAKAPGNEAAAHASTAAPAKASPALTPAPSKVADEEALTVSREFADAFLLYETGQTDSGVRAAFHATATDKLTTELLRRPPRLPANVEVPEAKVLNVAPGPQVGANSTVSVSLLRVGITSELRLSLHRGKDGTWLVNHVLG